MVLWNREIKMGIGGFGMKSGDLYASFNLNGTVVIPETFYTSLPHFESKAGSYGREGTWYLIPSELGIPNETKTYRDCDYIKLVKDIHTGAVVDTAISHPIITIEAIPEIDAENVCSGHGKTYSSEKKICITEGVEPPPEPKEEPKEEPDEDGKPTPPSDPLNISGWLGYIGELIGWHIERAIASLKDLIPQSILDFFEWLNQVRQDPSIIFLPIINAWFGKKSPSIHELVSQYIVDDISNVLKKPSERVNPFSLLYDFIEAPIKPLGEEMSNLIKDKTTYQIVEPRANKFYDNVGQIVASMNFGQIIVEGMSAGQLDTVTDAMSRLDNFLGYSEIAKQFRLQQATANILESWRQYTNKLYQNRLPDSSEIIQQRRLELIEPEPYYDSIARERGLSKHEAELLYRASLLPPTLDDYIIYNLRNKDTPLDLKAIGAIVNIDALRYEEIFRERLYNDFSLTMGRFMFEIQVIDKKGLERIAKVNRLRDKPLPDEKMSHQEMYVKWASGMQIRRWAFRALTALGTAYVEGVKTEEDMRTEAKKYLASEEAIDAYIDAYKNRKKIKEQKSKVFTPSQLATYRAYDSITDDQVDADIEGTKYDDDHKDALKDFVKKKTSEATLQMQKVAREAGEISYKLFTPSQLANMRVRNVITDTFIQQEVKRMPYDDEHKQIVLKDIQALIKEKEGGV